MSFAIASIDAFVNIKYSPSWSTLVLLRLRRFMLNKVYNQVLFF